jgi:hypothetical protein
MLIFQHKSSRILGAKLLKNAPNLAFAWTGKRPALPAFAVNSRANHRMKA